MVEYKRIQLRRDTSDNWQTENPVLMEGEIGVDLTSNNIKIGDGLKTWNELEYVSSDVDLSNYYTKDETEALVKATETTLELAIEEKVDNDTYNEKIGEIEAVLEKKANKTDIPSLDDYVTKDDYNVKMNAVDNAIATKADAESVNSRFGSVDGYLEDLHTEIEGKADAGSVPTKTSELTNDSGFLTEHQSLEGYATEQWVEGKGYLTEHQSLDNYYTKGETDNEIQSAKDSLEGEINSKAEIMQLKTGGSLYVYTELYEDIVKWETDGNYIASYPVLFKINNNVGYYTPVMYDSIAGNITFRETYFNGLRWGNIKNRLELYSGESYFLNSNGRLSVNTGSSSSTYVAGVAQVSDIPTKTSELTNDSGFLTEHQSLDNYYTKSETDTAIQGTKTALEGEINSKADIEDVPTYTTELTLAGRYGTTNLEVYAKEPQGIIPPNNEIWYKTTDGEYVDIINNMVFYNITNESGEEITHSVQYEDDGDLHKWIFSDDVYNVGFNWQNFELNNRITDIFIPSKVNGLTWGYQGETLKHIVFGGNTLGLNMDISSDSILELYRNEQIFIDGNLYCLVKVPSEFLEEYKRYLPTTRFEAIGDIESIATTDYVETAIGVVYNFNIASGNEYELIEQARAILQGIIRGEKVIVEYRNPSNTQLVTLSYDYIVEVENNQIDLGIHSYNETNQNTWHFYGSDLYSLVMQTTFLQIPSNTEMWTFELEDGSTITKEIYVR